MGVYRNQLLSAQEPKTKKEQARVRTRAYRLGRRVQDLANKDQIDERIANFVGPRKGCVEMLQYEPLRLAL